VSILRATTGVDRTALAPMLDAEQTLGLQRMVREVPAAEPTLRYAAALVRATRPDAPNAHELVKRYVRWGAGPRGGQALVLGAKASALLAGRQAVSPADIRRVALPVLRHRVLPNFAADAEGVSAEKIVSDVLDRVPEPKSGLHL
jgi:MoxR-like ATPase